MSNGEKQRSYAAKSALDKNQSTGAPTLSLCRKTAFSFCQALPDSRRPPDGAAGWNYSISMAQGIFWRYVEMKTQLMSAGQTIFLWH